MKGGKRLALLSGLGGWVGKEPAVQGDIGLRDGIKRKSWNWGAYERCYENLWQWKFLTYMKVILLKFSNNWGYRVPTDHLFSTKGSSSTGTLVHSTELLAKDVPWKCLPNPGWGWRDGSMVKSTDCSSRGPEFNSQKPHGGSQPSVMGSDVLFWCVSLYI